MLTFMGKDLELFVDEVFERDDGPRLFAARDFQGDRWIVLEAERRAKRIVWICAPISSRALECVRSKRADVWDALCHSLTGTVMIVTTECGQSMDDCLALCDAIPSQLLPPARQPRAAA